MLVKISFVFHTVLSRLPSAFKLSFITASACALAFLIHVLLFCVTDNEAILYNPLLSGYLHQDIGHFGLNMLVLFVCLLHPANQHFSFRQLFVINTLISSMYYPLVLFEFMPFAIGLSGTCNFFLCRALLLSRPAFKWLVALIGIFELLHVFDITRTAHLVHLIGLLFGGLSVWYRNKEVNLHIQA